jgi:hypothetical protein
MRLRGVRLRVLRSSLAQSLTIGSIPDRRHIMPALGISLILIAVGAILTFAVSTTVSGAALPTIGVILMIVGGLGILMAMLFLMSFSPWGTHEREHVDVVEPHTHLH